MQTLNHRFQLTSAQKRQTIWYCLAVALALFVAVMIAGSTDINEDVAGDITLIALGVLSGITVRIGVKRGWTYYAQQYLPNSTYVFTKEQKIGVLWRALMAWFAGRFIMLHLLDQASSDASLALLYLLSLILVTAMPLFIGLRFGWVSADRTMVSNPVTTTP